MTEEYKKKYETSVESEIDRVIVNKDAKDVYKLLFYNYYELDARIIHKSLREKKDEKALVEVFVSRPYWYLQTVDEEYKRIYGLSLKDDLAKDKKSDFNTFVLCIMNTPRSKKVVSKLKSKQEMQLKK